MTPFINFFYIILEWLNKLDFKGAAENFIGGLLLIIFLFIWNEIVRPKRNLTGEWEIENTVLNTKYTPYKKLKVIWRMHILQNGNTISGSGEKIKEIITDTSGVQHEHEYEPTKRDNVELQGSLEKNYLQKSRIFINVIQLGRLRKSRATYILEQENNSRLEGTFITTAASSRGSSVFLKNN